jgi:uncharacterized protein involved in tolerance to divalent cations
MENKLEIMTFYFWRKNVLRYIEKQIMICSSQKMQNNIHNIIINTFGIIL